MNTSEETIKSIIKNMQTVCRPFLDQSVSKNTREFIRDSAMEVLKGYIPIGMRIKPDPNDPLGIIIIPPVAVKHIVLEVSLAPQEYDGIYKQEGMDD